MPWLNNGIGPSTWGSFGTLYVLVVALGGCTSIGDLKQNLAPIHAPTIPDVGSVWVNTTHYINTGASRKPEELRVVRLHDGRPVVAGETFGYKGEILEGAFGTVIATESCASKVPAELLAPPPTPNQCGWHLCYPPEIGGVLIRKMIIYADLYSCEPKEGVYQFAATRVGTTPYGNVIVGDAQVDFGMFSKVSWESYIMPGYGEVHGESPGRVTSYSKVDVKLVKNTLIQIPTGPTNGAQSRLAELMNSNRHQLRQPRECRITAYGDSLTEGLGVARNETYPAVLSDLIGVEVCNLGASGRTTSVALEAISEVLAVRPKVVLLILGANDALRGLSRQQTKENITQIVNRLKADGIMVVLAGIDSRQPDVPKFLKELHQLYVEISNELTDDVLFVPSAMDGVLGIPEMTSSDGMHPSALGYRRLAKNLYDGAFSKAMDLLSVVPTIPAK